MPMLILIRCDVCSIDCSNRYNMFTIRKHISNPNDPEYMSKPLESEEIFICDECLNRLFDFPIEFREIEEEDY